jgi:tRNA A-37 threonylcarbamoyl transferase component Bud32
MSNEPTEPAEEKRDEPVAAPADDAPTQVSQSNPRPMSAITSFENQLLGRIVGSRYEVLSHIGKGGMSNVYKARDTEQNTVVAVKTVLPHLLEDEKNLKRFQREALSAMAVEHPNVAQVYKCDVTDDGIPYIIMEYVEGLALSDAIKQKDRMPHHRAVPIFLQIAEALQHAHTQGVVHRDLKPSNVLLQKKDGRDDFVKVVDFGLAKVLPTGNIQASTLTATGDVFGSPPYMSPEQCHGKHIDHRADVYSFGCLMYEAVAGRPPLVGETPVQTIVKQMNSVPPPMRDTCPQAGVPAKLEAIILKSLAKEPILRQQSMEEVSAELREFLGLQESGMEYKPLTPVQQAMQMVARNPKWCLWGGLAVVGLLCWVGYLWWEWVNEWRSGAVHMLISLVIFGGVLYAANKVFRLNKTMSAPETQIPVWRLDWRGENTGDLPAECKEDIDTANQLFSQDRIAEAQALYVQALHRWDLLELPKDRSYAYYTSRLGDCACYTGAFKGAEEFYERSMQSWKQCGDNANASLAFVKSAYTCMKRWKTVDADRLEKAVVAVQESFGDTSEQSASAVKLCSAYLWNNRSYTRALALTSRSRAGNSEAKING